MPINVERGPDRQDGKGRVRLTVFVGGVLKRYPLEIHVKASCWDTVHKRVKVGDTMHAVYNKAIEKALEKARTLEVEHPDYTADDLIAAMDQKLATGRSFYLVAKERLEQLGTKISFNTRRQKLSCLKIVEGIAPGITMHSLDHAAVERIEVALLGRVSRNTTTSKLKRLAAMWNDANEHYKLGLPSPFDKIEMKTTPTMKRGLFPEQMQKVMALDLSRRPRIVQLAQAAYVLQYLLNGMRWSDLCRAHTGWITSGVLTYQMHKSNKIIQWPVHPLAQEIMDRWPGEPFGKERFLLPLLKANMDPEAAETYVRIDRMNSEINRHLKIVAALAGVPPRLSTHWARHSNSVKAILSGVENRPLQDMMGHSSSRTTDEYTKALMGTMHLAAYKKMHG